MGAGLKNREHLVGPLYSSIILLDNACWTIPKMDSLQELNGVRVKCPSRVAIVKHSKYGIYSINHGVAPATVTYLRSIEK